MISTTCENGLLIISIDRRSRKNALSQDMYKDMAIAIEGAKQQETKCILIQGKNGIFTSGNDLTDFLHANESESVNHTYHFMKALLYCPIPVIAKVEGLAVGIGTTLLLHCDFVYAAHDSKFAMPFINLGLVPEYASSFLIPRTAGYLRANELLLLGESFDVTKAKECGIINEWFAESELDAQTERLIDKLLAKPVDALKASKALIRNELLPIQTHIDHELKVFARALNSEPAKEAFSAFIEKRPINKQIFK